MLKSCRYCGRMHKVGESCPGKPKSKKRITWCADTPERRFRSTQKWRDKRGEVKQRDHYMCRVCLDQSHINCGYLEVHHIVSLHDDFSRRLDGSNLISLCREHHEQAEKGQLTAAYLHKLVAAGVPSVCIPPG